MRAPKAEMWVEVPPASARSTAAAEDDRPVSPASSGSSSASEPPLAQKLRMNGHGGNSKEQADSLPPPPAPEPASTANTVSVSAPSVVEGSSSPHLAAVVSCVLIDTDPYPPTWFRA